jgi:hypothetical protein
MMNKLTKVHMKGSRRQRTENCVQLFYPTLSFLRDQRQKTDKIAAAAAAAAVVVVVVVAVVVVAVLVVVVVVE